MTHPKPRLPRPIAVSMALLCIATAASAQGLDSWSADLAVGFASGNGGDYHSREMMDARMALSRVYGRNASTGLFAEVALSATTRFDATTAICDVTPTGECRRTYPDVLGGAAVVGIALRPRERFEIRMGLGPTIYHVGSSRTNRELSFGATGQVDGAVFVSRRTGLIVGTRLVVVPNYESQTLWIAPWTVGMRVR